MIPSCWELSQRYLHWHEHKYFTYHPCEGGCSNKFMWLLIRKSIWTVRVLPKVAWLLSWRKRLTRWSRFQKLAVEMEESKGYYPISCTHCGWVGPSSQLDGGGYSYADDYDDIYCPVCGGGEDELSDME